MALTRQNTRSGQMGQIVPVILTGNGSKESPGKPVQCVPTLKELTDAAGNPEPALPTTAAESE